MRYIYIREENEVHGQWMPLAEVIADGVLNFAGAQYRVLFTTPSEDDPREENELLRAANLALGKTNENLLAQRDAAYASAQRKLDLSHEYEEQIVKLLVLEAAATTDIEVRDLVIEGLKRELQRLRDAATLSVRDFVHKYMEAN